MTDAITYNAHLDVVYTLRIYYFYYTTTSTTTTTTYTYAATTIIY